MQVVKFWIAAVLFFGIGVGVGSYAAWALLGRGATASAAVGLGATAGTFAAWLAFYLMEHVRRRCSRR